MSPAKFEIGQRVVVRNPEFPAYNHDGTFVVCRSYHAAGERLHSPIREASEKLTQGQWYYEVANDFGVILPEVCIFPFPDGSGQDFESFMDQLRLGQGVSA